MCDNKRRNTKVILQSKKCDLARTRTWNPLIRSQMPYPLGHRASCYSVVSKLAGRQIYCSPNWIWSTHFLDQVRLVGLGVWFSLRVREVPGSNPGRAQCFFGQNIEILQLDKKAPARFELAISCLLDRRFNQLSHGAGVLIAGHMFLGDKTNTTSEFPKRFRPTWGSNPRPWD